LFLYFVSVHRRREAELLVADLKSFNFATAGFREVRDVAIRNGGVPFQRDFLSQLHGFGTPLPLMPDLHGNVSFSRPVSFCTVQDCTFKLWITAPLARLPLRERTAAFLYATLPYVGIRPWVLFAMFDVRNGTLKRSMTAVEEIRIDKLHSYQRMVPFGYEVTTTAYGLEHSDCNKYGEQDYDIFLDQGHPVKTPQNVLHACITQTADAAKKRVFDIDLHCLNGIFRGCQFDELAPSAWADYSEKNGGTGNRNPTPK
jgi:hypothetical protein